MAVSKPLLTVFGIHHRLESCGDHAIDPLEKKVVTGEGMNLTRNFAYLFESKITTLIATVAGPVVPPHCLLTTGSPTGLATRMTWVPCQKGGKRGFTQTGGFSSLTTTQGRLSGRTQGETHI